MDFATARMLTRPSLLVGMTDAEALSSLRAWVSVHCCFKGGSDLSRMFPVLDATLRPLLFEFHVPIPSIMQWHTRESLAR